MNSPAARPVSNPEVLAKALESLVRSARERAREDPFGSPVLSVALAITRHLDRGELAVPDIAALVAHLSAEACRERAARLRTYLGGADPGADREAIRLVVAEVADRGPDRSSIAAFRTAVERIRFAAVFTAHPTFALPQAMWQAVAKAASGTGGQTEAIEAVGSHRPDKHLSLEDEFARARFAVLNARDAIDELNRTILLEARRRWPHRWREVRPSPVVLASWVGCDTDGRTDIQWWDTLRFRLESKRGQLQRLLGALPATEATASVRSTIGEALRAVGRQVEVAPALGSSPSIEAIQLFARTLVGNGESLCDSTALLAALDQAAADCAGEEDRTAVLIARAGLAGHGLALARPHFRLNAAQVHNAARRVVGIEGDPINPATRRTTLAAINRELEAVEPVPVDFGALAAERATAARLMMTVAQLVKFIDGSNPVRFLIAETETGYTLLAALWLARRFGVADRVEITPLFETAEALERGVRVLDEALRSPHWRDYLIATGRLVIQFGYSDSGRYIGQLAATFWIERMRLRISELLASHELTGIELVLFDTHGESIGRGAHPDSLKDRLAYLAPMRSCAQLADAGIPIRLETSFQGGDGYLMFGTEELALGTVARIAEHAFAKTETEPDLIYDQQDFAADFFATIRQEMEALVAEPGYAALLGTFGPNLLDPTGSRPSTREHDHLGRVKTITHPRQIRAIPNNAILHQLGWAANSFHGVGLAASRAPDLFREAEAQSERFGRAMRLAWRGMSISDLDVLRAYVDTLDPSVWLDRARRTLRPERRHELQAIAVALEELGLTDPLRRMFRRLTRDRLSAKAVIEDPPAMSARLMLFHAVRLALIHRIWFLATAIPDFSPQRGVSRDAILERILRLDVPASLALLGEIFPNAPDPTLRVDFGEPQGPRESAGYRREHETLFQPMGQLFDLVREISAGIGHEVGAFG